MEVSGPETLLLATARVFSGAMVVPLVLLGGVIIVCDLKLLYHLDDAYRGLRSLILSGDCR
jgi:hypothetical protein